MQNLDNSLPEQRDKQEALNLVNGANDNAEDIENNYKQLIYCPYCQDKLIKKGKRKKKYEEIQVYYCKNCEKKLTPVITKHKTYPLYVIIDSLSLYNKLNFYDEIINIIKDKYGMKITRQIILRWLNEYNDYIPFLRMREFASKKYSENKKEFIEESKLFHQQIYNFKYHRAKLELILNEEFKHFKFKPLQEFLELVIAECPHQLFQDSKRSSEFKDNKKTVFNMDEVKIINKYNQACKLAGFILQAISNNKLRHETLQEFMLYNDSCTVAVEVPVLLDNNDIKHYKHELNFEIPIELRLDEGEHITGHIDLIQIRNGMIHIMDFKPSASKEKPISQLVLYALALSRLTGLRLYNFKCAWFDDKNYYEFFPLHVVYKLRSKQRKKKIDKKQRKL